MDRLLVVSDYQKDFVDGALGFPGAEKLEGPIMEAIASFQNPGDEIIFLQDTHDDNYLHTEEGRNLPVIHCIEGTPGHDLYGQIKKAAEGHTVFEKSTFGSYRLYEYVKSHDFKTIVIVGLDASICVLANSIMCKTAAPDAHIEVLKNAIGCDDPKAFEATLTVMKRLHIEVRDSLPPAGRVF